MWILNVRARKHLTFHRTTLDTYEGVALYNAYLDGDSI